MSERARCWAVIPAAGIGARMGADKPKQYLPLLGKTVIEWTLEKLAAQPQLSGVVVALAPDDRYWDTLQIDNGLPVQRAEGGSERCHSVLNALQVLRAQAAADDWVLVHDAARPCVRNSDIDRLVESVSRHAVGGLLATPVRDTMKRCDDSATVLETVSRERLWHALTPQMFRLGPLQQALHAAIAAGIGVTDEASAMEYAGWMPRVVPGHGDNIKITQPEDLVLAQFYLQQQGMIA